MSRDPPPGTEAHVFRLALLAGCPGVVAALALAIAHGVSIKALVTLVLVLVASWLGAAVAIRRHVARSLRTIANLLTSYREGDYTLRARHAAGSDALGEAMRAVNQLGDVLRARRVSEAEAETLLAYLLEEVDVGVLAFDEARNVRLVNATAERLLGEARGRLLGRRADSLRVLGLLDGEAPRLLDVSFQGKRDRWELRRAPFRRGGLQHELVMLTDVSRALRVEERNAWQRLVRVISHEINNSLAPIQSVASALQELFRREHVPPELADVPEGLDIVARRAESLSRFIAAYAQLARLPPPSRRPCDVRALIRRAAALERRVAVEVLDGPPVAVEGDPDQLEQLLINLVRNGVDATFDRGGHVGVTWATRRGEVEIRVRDDGPGLAPSANLFVPFFTTKPGGSGIGLALSREIAEAHGGSLAVHNLEGGGCEAVLALPLPPPRPFASEDATGH